jgi:hypothetical protein
MNPLRPTEVTGTIYIDHGNVGGSSANTNDGRSPQTAVLDYSEIVSRWGDSLSPLVGSTTRLVFLSPHPDPVLWSPRATGASTSVSIEGGAPTDVSSSVVLSGTVPLSRAVGSNAKLATNLGPLGAVGQIVENRSRTPWSRAVVYKSLGGGAFLLGQPFVSASVPGPFALARDDGWADGQTVALLAPVPVNVVSFVPEFLVDNGFQNENNTAYLYQIAGTSPELRAHMAIGEVRILESTLARVLRPDPDCLFNGTKLTNVLLTGGIVGKGQGVVILGGAATATALVALHGLGHSTSGGIILDQDFILGAGFIPRFSGEIAIGFLCLDVNLTFDWGAITIQGQFYDDASELQAGIYGPGNLFFEAQTHLAQVAGRSVEVLTGDALVSPGLKLNGISTGCAFSGGSIVSGIATTPGNLDTYGTLFNLGGASASLQV